MLQVLAWNPPDFWDRYHSGSVVLSLRLGCHRFPAWENRSIACDTRFQPPNAPEIRARVCREAGWLGISLDEAANDIGGPRISTAEARTSAWVIPTDENLMIARHTLAVLAASPTSRA